MMVDLIVENGRIQTGDPEAPVVDAVAVLNGRIVAAGNDVEGLRARERVDAHDRVVLPGFNDAHAHSVWFGMTLIETDLSGVRSLDDLYRIIGDRARDGGADEWLQLGPVKVFTDGSVLGRTAQLSEPYEGCPGYHGYLQEDQESLRRRVLDAYAAGWSLALHAVGDAVGKLGPDTEVDGLIGGVSVEQVGYPVAGHDDAGVAVAGCQDAQAASLQMERCRVSPSGQRVQDDGDGEFGALQAVSGVYPDHPDGRRGGLSQGLADLVGLIAVGDSDHDVLWAERLAARVSFACADGPAGQLHGMGPKALRIIEDNLAKQGLRLS